MTIQFHDTLVSFEDASIYGDLAIKRTQEMPDDWLSALKRKVLPSKWASGEYEKLFSVPVIVIQQWRDEGYDFYKMSDDEVARKLRADGLDAFIVGRI